MAGKPPVQEDFKLFCNSLPAVLGIAHQIAQAVGNQLMLEPVILQPGKARRFHQDFLAREMRQGIVHQFPHHLTHQHVFARIPDTCMKPVRNLEQAPVVGVDLRVADEQDVGPGNDRPDG